MASGTVGEEGGGHLGAARVVTAHEQHTGQAHAGRPLDVRERVEPLGGKVLGQHHQVGTDAGALGEALVGIDDQALDRLGREASAVAAGKTGDAGRKTLIWQGRGR
jgi:hypothetical protein